MFFENVHVEYTQFCAIFLKPVRWIYRIVYIFSKMDTLNIENYVHSLKQCVQSMSRILYIVWKIGFLNVKNCVYSLKNCASWIYRIMHNFFLKKTGILNYRIVYIIIKII